MAGLERPRENGDETRADRDHHRHRDWWPPRPKGCLPSAGPSRGSVSAASSGSRTRTKEGGTTTVQGRRASGSRTVTQTGDGYNVNKQVQTQSGASKSVSKDVNVEDREIDKTSTTTNQWGQSATREREVEGQGGYATIEGSTKTSTGREASSDLVAGRNVYGQPAVAGSVNTKYNGNYNVAAGRNAYGGWNTAVAGPYGGRVTTTLPSGYRTSTYYGRPYYTLRWRLLPAVHAPRCALLLPRSRAVLRLLLQPAGGRDHGGGGRRDLPDVEGWQLQQEDHEQRRQGGVPVRAPAAGRDHQDAPRGAGPRDRLGHHVLLERERVLSPRDERGAGDLRRRDAARRRRVRPGLARRFRGRAIEHDVLLRQGAVLRAVSIRRRQGAVRDGGPPADSTACRKTTTAPRRPPPLQRQRPVRHRPLHLPHLFRLLRSASSSPREHSSWCDLPPT